MGININLYYLSWFMNSLKRMEVILKPINYSSKYFNYLIYPLNFTIFNIIYSKNNIPSMWLDNNLANHKKWELSIPFTNLYNGIYRIKHLNFTTWYFNFSFIVSQTRKNLLFFIKSMYLAKLSLAFGKAIFFYNKSGTLFKSLL